MVGYVSFIIIYHSLFSRNLILSILFDLNELFHFIFIVELKLLDGLRCLIFIYVHLSFSLVFISLSIETELISASFCCLNGTLRLFSLIIIWWSPFYFQDHLSLFIELYHSSQDSSPFFRNYLSISVITEVRPVYLK